MTGCGLRRLAGPALVLGLAAGAGTVAQGQGQVRATQITVTTASDVTNGDLSTVAGLIANPGPDGISLRELDGSGVPLTAAA